MRDKSRSSQIRPFPQAFDPGRVARNPLLQGQPFRCREPSRVAAHPPLADGEVIGPSRGLRFVFGDAPSLGLHALEITATACSLRFHSSLPGLDMERPGSPFPVAGVK